MLEINNNKEFVNLEKKNFWAGVDENVLKTFAQRVVHSSVTAFKVKFDILLETHLDKAKEMCDEFVAYCKENNYTISEEFNSNVNAVFGKVNQSTKQKESKHINLTKWKNRYHRKKVNNREREL